MPRRFWRDKLPGSDDGTGVQMFRVIGESNFALLREIAAQICEIGNRNIRNPASEFYPHFSDKQSSLLTWNNFHIVIDSSASLCRLLHLSEMSDRKSILHRHASLNGENVNRIAGHMYRLKEQVFNNPPFIYTLGLLQVVDMLMRIVSWIWDLAHSQTMGKYPAVEITAQQGGNFKSPASLNRDRLGKRKYRDITLYWSCPR